MRGVLGARGWVARGHRGPHEGATAGMGARRVLEGACRVGDVAGGMGNARYIVIALLHMFSAA